MKLDPKVVTPVAIVVIVIALFFVFRTVKQVTTVPEAPPIATSGDVAPGGAAVAPPAK